jgi:hypothetical protein
MNDLLKEFVKRGSQIVNALEIDETVFGKIRKTFIPTDFQMERIYFLERKVFRRHEWRGSTGHGISLFSSDS